MRAEALVLAALLLTGCGSAPKPVDPPRLRAALAAESDGARRYGRGDYAVAERRFGEALQLFASIDDAPGRTRNRLHLARARLALGRADAALELLDGADAGPEPAPALDALLLRAQAQLALAREADARHSLDLASQRCAAACPQAASLHLLRASAALDSARAAEALAHADAGLKLLQGNENAHETGNAWRLVAAARLGSGDADGALLAARNALDIDRRLALPEKIARDWLLIGDIRQKVGARDSAARARDTAEAYQRALDVANAAGLSEVARSATESLMKFRYNEKSAQ